MQRSVSDRPAARAFDALSERTIVHVSTDAMSASEEADTAMALPADFEARLGVVARKVIDPLERPVTDSTGSDVREKASIGAPKPPVPPVPSSQAIRTPAPIAVVQGPSFGASSPALVASAPPSSRRVIGAPPLPLPQPIPSVPPVMVEVVDVVDALAPTYPPPPVVVPMPVIIAEQVLEEVPDEMLVPAESVPPVPESNRSYERAFRTWSSPSLMIDQDPRVPLSYQVYTQEDLAHRSPAKAASPAAASTPSLGLRICMILLGVCVVFGTAAAVIAASSEEPKPRPAEPVELPSEPVTPPAVETAPPSIATAVSPAPSAAATDAPLKPGRGSRSAPSGLRGMAPPPNPYGGAPASSKPAHK